MTAYATTGAGNWSNAGGTIWDGDGGPPANGDTATVDHAVTVDENTTVGASDVEDNDAITQNADLTVATGYTLTVRGDHTVAAGDSTILQAGAHYKFDSSAAASPSTTQYRWRSLESLDTHGKFICQGTTGSHCTVSSVTSASAKAGQFRNSSASSGVMQADFTDFSDLGTGDGTDGMIYNFEPEAAAGGYNSWFEDCTFTRCGQISFNNAVSRSLWFERCTWADSVGSLNVEVTASGAAEDVHFTDCVFDQGNRIYLAATLTRCYIPNRISTSGATVKTGVDSMLINPDTGELTKWESFTRGCVLLNGGGVGGPHGFQASAFSTYDFEDIIFATGNDGTSGDCIVTSSGEPVSGTTLTVTGCLTLPNSDGVNGVGTMSSSLPTTDITYTCDHNTIFVQGVVIGETNEPDAGFIASFRSNIVYGTATSGNYKLADSGTDTNNPDVVTSANCDYNAGYLLTAGSNGKGYNQLEFSSGTPGDNDVEGVDPSFVDPDRHVPTYDIDGLGSATGTAWADAAEYDVGDVVSAATTGVYGGQTINYRCITSHIADDGHATNGKPGDTTTTSWHTNWEWQTLFRLREDTARIPLMATWIRAGFAPTAWAYRNAGHDGVTIGAIEGSFATASSSGAFVGPIQGVI